MFLAYVTHDLINNTLEAVWLNPVKGADGEVVAYDRIKSRNYSPEQKDEFLADCGPDAEKYTRLAGW